MVPKQIEAMDDLFYLPVVARVLILADSVATSATWLHALKQENIEAEVRSYDWLSDIVPEIDSFQGVLVDHFGDPDSALQVCQRIRGMTQQPLLLFTYETDERFHLEPYRAGVEECVQKPIGIPLLVAKTRAWLRQACQYQREGPVQNLTGYGFSLDTETSVLTMSENSAKLSHLECRLMSVLMANQGQVMESQLLVDRVWSMHSDPDPQLLKNLVYRLRQKLDRISDGRQYVHSVSGIGYVFEQ